jgi:ubiquinone/menaquinone biosynthesis C-methylase UbiE
MNVQKAYNAWSEQYDTNDNKTRDLEALALRATLQDFKVKNCLEIGCGTGKNTVFLMTIAKHITAVDLSDKMLEKAHAKITSKQVRFQQADILQDWHFATKKYDLAIFSLVLEHIENLDLVFEKLSNCIKKGGYVYIGELHPFKQYNGTKARFETAEGLQIVTCFNHNISDFTQSALKYGFSIVDVNEYFDEGDRGNIPRILSVLFKKR